MINYSIPKEFILKNSFIVRAKDSDQNAGEAIFSRSQEGQEGGNVGIWQALVNVNKSYLRQGIGSGLLTTGDSYIHKHHPNDVREFNNQRAPEGYGYKRYTDRITDTQLISFEGNCLRFRP